MEIAASSAAAAEAALRSAHAAPALGHAFWLLTQIPLAARSPDPAASLEKLGLRLGPNLTLLAVVGAFTEAVDRHAKREGAKYAFRFFAPAFPRHVCAWQPSLRRLRKLARACIHVFLAASRGWPGQSPAMASYGKIDHVDWPSAASERAMFRRAAAS